MTRFACSFAYSLRSLQSNVLPFQEPVASTSSPSKLAKIKQSAERQQKKQKRKEDEGQLHVKRQEMDKAKVCSVISLYISYSYIA